MKNQPIVLRLLVGIAFTGCTLFSCTPPFNHQFIGSYSALETITCYGSQPPCSTTTNTVLQVVAGSSDSSVSVLGLDVLLQSSSNGWTGTAYHFGVTFRNDSIFATRMNGGLGGGTYENYIGKKQ